MSAKPLYDIPDGLICVPKNTWDYACKTRDNFLKLLTFVEGRIEELTNEVNNSKDVFDEVFGQLTELKSIHKMMKGVTK